MAPWHDPLIDEIPEDDGVTCRAVRKDGSDCRSPRSGGTELCNGHRLAVSKAKG